MEIERLRKAVREAGFKPGDLRYRTTGALTEWRGELALRGRGTDPEVVLRDDPAASAAYDQARRALSTMGDRPVAVEGEYLEDFGQADRRAEPAGATRADRKMRPAVVRLRRLVVPGS